MELEEKLRAKIDALLSEARSIVDARMEHERQIFEIDTRLAHISGAISELEQVLESED